MTRTLILALTVGFQMTSAVASIGRVRTSNYIYSRSFNALALGAVAADFAIKYFVTGRGDYLTMQVVFAHRADDLTGLLVFTVLTLRTDIDPVHRLARSQLARTQDHLCGSVHSLLSMHDRGPNFRGLSVPRARASSCHRYRDRVYRRGEQ
jgi:hypothetical protein